MNFQTAISTCLSKYATFSGRAPRSEFWWFYLFTALVDIIMAVIDGATDMGGALVALGHLGLLLPSLAVGARRLHDIDRSGWWQLILFIPLVGWIILLYWLTRPTQPGPNRFGDEPRTVAF